MSRNFVLVTGGLLWAAFAIDAAFHVATGDWMAPATAMLVGAVWLTNRRVKRALTITRPVASTQD
jgi:hypothetical protein